ncbi:MAG TPA: ABC transporter substrate-binding protein [Candidatus Paenalcaligenes intestinipullorum]|uniref:ABC transporter substrate-binding protein n=1 Tax=Candidatus Paenalcaligenes intestinipullorum TaxID=2838718 RepID=A0A9D2U8E5_9BURK|nr:ABC transporter substrate-binding protein [Candidatus Paenalcaligenes intestinipullorum]
MNASTSKTRRDLLKLAGLFSLGGALPLLSSFSQRVHAEPNAPLRIGYLPITDATPLLVAHNNGYFEEAGVVAEKPVMVRSWAQLIESFLAGQVNVVHLLTPMTIWGRYGSQAPAKVVAWNHMSGSAITVGHDIQSVQDLGGKTVAVPFWYSIHNVMLQHLLRANGLKPVTRRRGKLADDEVALVIMAPADMPPALVSQRIAGFTVAEPFNAAAETLGAGRILRFTGDMWREHACCVTFMHEHDLENRPEWSQGVVDALVKAQLWTLENRDETARILSSEGANRYTPHSYENLVKVLNPAPEARQAYIDSGAIQHPDWNDKRIDFQPYPFPSYTEELVKLLQNTQIDADRGFLDALDPAWVAQDLVDDRFVKAAIDKIGGLQRFGLENNRYTRNESIQA